MNYIINPAVFYWMSVADNSKTLAGIIVGFCVVAIIGLLAWMDINCNDFEDTPWAKTAFVCLLACAFIFVLAAIFIPSEQTMTRMLVAKYATYDAAENVIEAVKNTAEYIIGVVKEAQG